MIIQLAVVAILQTVFFTFYYRYGLVVAKIIGRRVCPVCFAVGSTWLSLLVLKYTGIIPVEKYLIAMLLAESVVGVSYLTEEYSMLHQVKIPDYIFKFGIIIYGTTAVMTFAFVNTLIGFCMFLPVIIFGFMAFTPNNIGNTR